MQNNYDEVHFGNHHCLNCGKLLDPKLVKQGNKFCSKSCAGTYNNTGRKHSEESKEHLKETQKNSEKVRKAIIKRFYNGDEELYNKVQEEKNFKKEFFKQKRKERILKKKLVNEQNNNLNDIKIHKTQIGHCEICGRELIDGKCLNDFCIKYRQIKFKKLSKYFGFDMSKYGTIEVEHEFNRIKNMLYDLYWNQHLSSIQLTERFNLPKNSIFNYFRKFEIPSKTLSYAIKEGIEENRIICSQSEHFHGRYESHITWNNK
jgi:hypothetical protein